MLDHFWKKLVHLIYLFFSVKNRFFTDFYSANCHWSSVFIWVLIFILIRINFYVWFDLEFLNLRNLLIRVIKFLSESSQEIVKFVKEKSWISIRVLTQELFYLLLCRFHNFFLFRRWPLRAAHTFLFFLLFEYFKSFWFFRVQFIESIRSLIKVLNESLLFLVIKVRNVILIFKCVILLYLILRSSSHSNFLLLFLWTFNTRFSTEFQFNLISSLFNIWWSEIFYLRSWI